MGTNADERRHELEAIAFGEGTTAAERADALRALGVKPVKAGPVPAPESSTEAMEDPGHAEAETSAPTPRSQSRIVATAALLAGMLVVGGAAGFGIRTATAPTAEATPDSALTSRLAAGDPATSASDPAMDSTLTNDDTLNSPAASPTSDVSTAQAQADSLFVGDQTTLDKYPFPPDAGSDTDFTASTTRLVLTSAQGMRVWVAERAGDGGGYCLLITSRADSSNGLAGSSTCASPGSFAANGMTLTMSSLTATWTGSSVGISVTG
ncbi:hypothetical protein EDF46_0912 [Frondihabitans sp. PhB188]|uniref:hypothetical protein n=1 Tax=Frondihabitans sp. PhB188 TaxID=2485200 RepID=UPI000F490A90|nr:hypothetical protein [Frondihabitans sp. PhB188]ROQ41532.1 hypothetical protein EDF46_0912 [Frondihabitans sp. PhB188]